MNKQEHLPRGPMGPVAASRVADRRGEKPLRSPFWTRTQTWSAEALNPPFINLLRCVALTLSLSR